LIRRSPPGTNDRTKIPSVRNPSATRRAAAGLGPCLLALAVAGCSTGQRTWTPIQVTTDPPGAHCELIRGNLNLHGFDTPGKVRLDGSRLGAVFVCVKDGYRDAIVVLRPLTRSLTLKSLIVPMGGLVSATSGKDNSYDETLAITLEQDDAPP